MTGSEGFSKEEVERVTKWQFKGLDDAARLMMKRPPGPKVVGRWDWHFWMFLVSTCLPCFGVYCLAMWVRAGLWEEYGKQQVLEPQAEPEKAETITHEQLSSLQKEIQKLKLMVWLHGKYTPQLSPESMRRLYEQSHAPSKEDKDVVEDASATRTVSLSDRIWNRVKPWLPFYVEPFYVKKDGPPPQTDFTALRKPSPRSGN